MGEPEIFSKGAKVEISSGGKDSKNFGEGQAIIYIYIYIY